MNRAERYRELAKRLRESRREEEIERCKRAVVRAERRVLAAVMRDYMKHGPTTEGLMVVPSALVASMHNARLALRRDRRK